MERHRQLNLFEPLETIELGMMECDSNKNVFVHDIVLRGVMCYGIIKNHVYIEVTQEELISIYKRAISMEQSKFGYEAFVQVHGKYYLVFFRFTNRTTAKSTDVFDFIHKNWNDYFKG